MEGEQPYLGDLLTMVVNHLLTGMILQAVTFTNLENASDFSPRKKHWFLSPKRIKKVTWSGNAKGYPPWN